MKNHESVNDGINRFRTYGDRIDYLQQRHQCATEGYEPFRFLRGSVNQALGVILTMDAVTVAVTSGVEQTGAGVIGAGVLALGGAWNGAGLNLNRLMRQDARTAREQAVHLSEEAGVLAPDWAGGPNVSAVEVDQPRDMLTEPLHTSAAIDTTAHRA